MGIDWRDWGPRGLTAQVGPVTLWVAPRGDAWEAGASCGLDERTAAAESAEDGRRAAVECGREMVGGWREELEG